ncbi:TetR/AcrR family transcriptional regulator [Arenibaculum sp.]|jgi:AcrR family transcriptional regulator|uniref:TetR/AcrR family transcriptional regulator n=1 Tax=Arenibaculum sp. TaxID=2865862 RepID=UPI002E163B00|nr:TetR/AcrR family transcriptional regulator [Arenibaculum sp.]
MPRGRPRQFDEGAALDAALRLFWRHGYEGTSISTLAQAMGLTVASVYNAFGNKESLFMKAVGHYDRYSASLYEEAFAMTSAREVARGILMGEVDLVSGDATPEGCLMIQGALATGPESEAVQKAMASLRRQAEADVAARFAQVQQAGGLPPGWSAKALAGYVMTVATGMAVQAKSGASRQELIDVVDMAMRIWPEDQRG